MWVPLLLVVELTVPTLAAVSQSTDWLVHPFTQHTAVVREGDVLRLGNGLIERTFFPPHRVTISARRAGLLDSKSALLDRHRAGPGSRGYRGDAPRPREAC